MTRDRAQKVMPQDTDQTENTLFETWSRIHEADRKRRERPIDWHIVIAWFGFTMGSVVVFYVLLYLAAQAIIDLMGL